MSQHKRGESTLEIEGKRYTFVLDMTAMALLEEMFSTPEQDMSIQQFMQRVQKTGQVRYMRALVWAMLQHHHPEITLQQAGQLFTLETMVNLNALVNGVMTEASPDPSDARELGLNRPQRARVNGRSGVPTTGGTSKSKHASLA